MKRLLTFLYILFALTSFGQIQDSTQDEYYREIDWKFIPDSVVQLSDTTYLFKAQPYDYNDPGAIDRLMGNYIVDFVGRRYKIIDSTLTTITVEDEYQTGKAPQSSQIARCYKSVGNGLAEYVGSVDYSPLDLSTRWKLNGADN